MSRPIPESTWSLATVIASNTKPPRDPDDDDDDDEEDSENENGNQEPPVVREPDE